MIKRKIILDKRGIAMKKVITVVLVFFVVASVLIFLFRVDINNFLRNIIPGYSLSEEGEENGVGEDEKIMDVILSKFEGGAHITDLEEFFSVVGCKNEFDSDNDDHNNALATFLRDTGFETFEFDYRNSEDIETLKTVYVNNGSVVTNEEILREVSSGYHLDCKEIISVNSKGPYYHDIEGYYYVETKDGSHYMYNTGSDILKNYIIKLKSKGEADKFEVTWELIHNNVNEEIVFEVDNKEVKSTGEFDNHQGFLNDLYYVETEGDYHYVYANKYSVAYGGNKGDIAKLGPEEKLTDFRMTWSIFYKTYLNNNYYINNRKVISVYPSGPILHYIKTEIEDSEDYIYYIYDGDNSVNDYIKEVNSSSPHYTES